MNVLSLFSGAGGAVEGFKQAGHNVVAAVDFDEDCCETLRVNHDDVQVIQEDLSAVTPQEFALEYEIAPSDIDVVVGGPPCQGFSLQGNRNVDDERNELVSNFLNYISLYNPKAAVMENVEGILSLDDGAAVMYMEEWTKDSSYTLHYKVLSAEQYGVPQVRRRVFFIFDKNRCFSWPERNDSVQTVNDAFDKIIPNHENHKIHNKMPKTEQKISNTKPGEAIYDSYNKNIRLQFDKPAPTLVSSGGSWQLGHPTKDRVLTVHERGLLQSFPNTYTFKGTLSSCRIQTGNALPPRLAREIAKQL